MSEPEQDWDPELESERDEDDVKPRKKIKIEAPDGTVYKIKVTNTGELTTS